MRGAIALVLLVLSGCGASREEWPPGDLGDPAARAREAEAALRRLGEGRFTVEAFRVDREVKLTFLDDYEFPTRVLAVNFEATVRAPRDLPVPREDEIMGRHAAADLSLGDFERDAELLRVLGRSLGAGEARTVRASAAFDLAAPALRFRHLDRERSAP